MTIASGAEPVEAEPCAGCPACLPFRDRAGLVLPVPFVVAGYGRVVGDEFVARDSACVDAWGMALPDGRAVTVEVARGRVQQWDRPQEAAWHWGGYLLWPGRRAGTGDGLTCVSEPDR